MKLTVGDIYKHEVTGEIVLIGHANETGGVCDDCTHAFLRHSGHGLAEGWKLIDNVRSELKTVKNRAYIVCPNCKRLVKTKYEHEQVSHHNGDLYWGCTRAK